MPAYRPVTNNLTADRNTFNNAIERGFILVMFGGVVMMSSASQIWRATGGKLNSEVFRYKIGGEW